MDAVLATWRRRDDRIGDRAARDADVARRGHRPRRLRAMPSPRPNLSSPPAPHRPPAALVVPTALSTDEHGTPWLARLLRSAVPTLAATDELVVVTDPPLVDRVRDLLESAGCPQGRVITDDRPFSFSARVNLGVASTAGPIVVCLNDDLEVIEPWWLDRLAAMAAVRGVGAVGATLLYPDRSIQHAGLTTTQHLPTHAWYGWPPDDPAVPRHDRRVWAVTGAAMAVARRDWDRVGGLSETFPLNYNDVDLCLKLDVLGRWNVVLGTPSLVHHESRTRPAEVTQAEMEDLHHRWFHRLGPDELELDTAAVRDRRWMA